MSVAMALAPGAEGGASLSRGYSGRTRLTWKEASMNTDELRSAYLSAVGSHMEITETPSGYVVWAPLFYSDGDGVVLSVYPDAGGWLITDEGSTLSHLIDSGASVDGAVFTEA